MKPCPFCAEMIQDLAIKCRFCGSDLGGSSTNAAPGVTLRDAGESAVFHFTAIKAAATLKILQTALSQEGYQLEEGNPADGTFGKGSAAGRLLLGSFSDRHKIRVRVTERPDGSDAVISSGMTGWSGGILGVAKEKKQFSHLKSALLVALERQLSHETT